MAVEVRWEPFRGREVAAVDFAAAADAVQGVLPCSDGERQVLLVAASIAEGIPVDLREAALCLDAANAARAARAVCHAAGRGVPVVTEPGGDRRAAGHGGDHPPASPAARGWSCACWAGCAGTAGWSCCWCCPMAASG